MPSTDLVFRFLGVDAGAGRQFERMAGKAGLTEGAMNKLAIGTLAAGVTIAAASVKMAGDFQQQTNILVTAAGESQKNLKTVRDGILSIARDTGTSWRQLTDGMYVAEKAFYRGADGLKVLRAAAQGAREEGANLSDVVNGMTSIMMSYHLTADKSVQVMNAMKTAAGESKTTFELFSKSLASVLPIASANKISFAQVAGALATLTQHGTSADEATQELAATIRAMAAPNRVAQNQMQQLGLSVNDVQLKLGRRGLTGTLQLYVDAITKHMGPSGLVVQNAFNQSASAMRDANLIITKLPPNVAKLAKEYQSGTISLKDWRSALKALPADQASLAQQFAVVQNKAAGFNSLLRSGDPAAQTFTAALKKMLNGAIGLNTALQLTGENMPAFQERVDRVGHSMADNSKNVEGWASTAQLLNVRADKLKQTVQSLGIVIGTALIPPLESAAGFFAHHTTLVKSLGIAIATVLTANLVRFGVASTIAFGKATVAAATWVATQAAGIAESVALWALYTKETIGAALANRGFAVSSVAATTALEGEAVAAGGAATGLTAVKASAFGARLGLAGAALSALSLINILNNQNGLPKSASLLDRVTNALGSAMVFGTQRGERAPGSHGTVKLPDGTSSKFTTSLQFVPDPARVRQDAESVKVLNEVLVKNVGLDKLAAAANKAHSAALARQIASLRGLTGAFATAKAAGLSGGVIIGTNLDAGLVIGIRQGQDKIQIVAKQTVDGALHTMTRTASIQSPSKKTAYIGRMLAEGLLTGWQGAAGAVYDKLSSSLKGGLDKLSRDVQAAQQFRDGARSAALGYADVTGATSAGVSARTYLSARANDLKRFARDLGRLKRMGLSPALIAEIAAVGPAAISVAEDIIQSGAGGVRADNAAERAIQRYAGAAAATAEHAVYGPQLHKDLQALPDRIAKAIVSSGGINVYLDGHKATGGTVTRRRRGG